MSGTTDGIEVLHVDDNPDLTELVATFLEREDDRFDVRTATTPDGGLDVLRDSDIDCVVSDYDMPHTDGIEFLETVRAECPDLPFILYTGKGSEELASDAISAGVTDYLQKESGTSQYAVLANRVANVVEQHRSRQAIEETEQKLSQIADKTDDVLFMFDEDWSEVLFINSTYEEMWETTVAELKENPESFVEQIHPADREKATQSMERLVDGETDEVEYRVHAADGEYRWVRGETKPILDDDGNVTRIVGFVRDITEQREREREARRKERRYQAVFNDPNILAGLIDTDGTVLDINQTALDYVDATSEEVVGETFWETSWFTGADDVRTEITEGIHRARDGEYVEFENELVRPDGSPYVVAGVFRPVTDEDGDVVSILFSGRDISERKEREQELERYESYLEESNDIITVLADSGAIEYESPAVSRILGYEPGELIGQDGFEFIHPDDVEDVYDTFTDLVADPEASVTVECRFRTADGEWRWLEVRGTNHLDHEAINGIMTNNRDITERKARERELQQQNERLEELASVVSHDLRNPLRVANARVELARAECDSDHLDDIAGALDRMDTLIEDLLTLAREGDAVIEPEPLDLEAVVEGCWTNVETASATLTTDVDRTIQADESRLKQLFENLLRNAVEHGGESVTVTVGELEDGFYLEDDGVGFPEEVPDDVFETGYSTSERGTGFGLSIVERIVDSHGWAIRATEGTSGGARFEITGLGTTGE